MRVMIWILVLLFISSARAQVTIKDPLFSPPQWTTATRPVCPSPFGCFGYNTDIKTTEFYDGAAWESGAGDVMGPSSATALSLAAFNGTTGKMIQSTPYTQAASGYLSLGDSSVAATGTQGQLALYGSDTIPGKINFVNAQTAAAVYLNGPKTSTVTYDMYLPQSAPAINQIMQSDASGNLSWINTPIGGGGDVVGPASSVTGTVAQFSDATGKIINGTAWTVPNAIGSVGQYLAVTGGQDTGWTSFPSGIVYVGGAPVVADNLPKFGGTAGTQITDSGIASANVVTQAATSTGANFVKLSTNGSNVLVDSGYTIPSTIGTAGQVLTASGTAAIWAASGNGDVTGPSSSASNQFALFNGTTGKLIKVSDGLTYNSGTLTQSITDDFSGTSNGSDSLLNLTFNSIDQNSTAGANGSAGINLGYAYAPNGGSNPPINKTGLIMLDGTGGKVTLSDNGLNIVSLSGATSSAPPSLALSGEMQPVISLSHVGGLATTSIGLKSPANTGTALNYMLTLPNTAPTVNQIMQSDAAGQLSWINTPSGSIASGDVVGPASSTSSAFPIFSDTTGKLLANSPLTLDAFGNVRLQATVGAFYPTLFLTDSFNDGGARTGSYDATGFGLITREVGNFNQIALHTPSTLATGYSMILPSQPPADNQIMQSDASGNLSWINTPTAGTPTSYYKTIFNAYGYAGAGSTNTSSMYFTNTRPAANTDCFTVTNDSAEGFYITVNKTCLISLSFSAGNAASLVNAGFTLNPSGAQLTADFSAIPAAQKLCDTTVVGIDQNSAYCSFSWDGVAGQKIYLQGPVGTVYPYPGKFYVSIAGSDVSAGSGGGGGGAVAVPTCTGSQRLTGNGTALSCVDNTYQAVTALDLDWSSAHVFYKSVTTAQAFTFSGQADGQVIVVIVQNTSGADIAATFPASLWAGGTILSNVPANSSTVFTFTRAGSANYASATVDVK